MQSCGTTDAAERVRYLLAERDRLAQIAPALHGADRDVALHHLRVIEREISTLPDLPQDQRPGHRLGRWYHQLTQGWSGEGENR